ncbi:GH116 family glycosyl-hydrolase [Actinopolymorpha alba]|uniref:GH116 family glycosyl-hydrolase n=1 Tax=Actinopolymorpha alba TaxID=533267 RepID=UPI0003AA54D5|nr:GH116 family glycosyl-hydrolase [Actinopolymorpha alba]
MALDVPDWPVLRTYDTAHALRVALPLGGIGTGTVSLGGRGDLRDWEVVNRPAKGWAPAASFFAIRTAPIGDGGQEVGSGDAGSGVVARALEGPIDPVLYEGAHGSAVPNHGLPRFRRSTFLAAYPLGQVVLDDPDVPVEVRLQAFNPLVPADVDASGIPVAVLRYVVTNTSDQAHEVSVVGNVQNFVGTDGSEGKPAGNRNTVRDAGPCAGVFLHSDGVAGDAEQWGSLALAVVGEPEVTRRTSWAEHSWGGQLLDFWDDFVVDGRVDEREGSAAAPMASVAATRRLAPGEAHAFTFLLGWHFPNRLSWNREHTIGNYYATTYPDAWQVVLDTARDLADLERQTVAFVNAFVGSDLPDAVKEAALFNVSTLRSQTCFRTPDGRFWGWEGCNDRSGSCHGNCTHVWNYEQVTPYLFGTLARSMRETEFRYATGDDGHMSFRVQQPLDRARADGVAAADGQMGCLVRLYREWRHSGDDELLRALWPKARRACEFAWIPGGWDADRDGVMEGSQHNTMDVEYFGPNPEIGAWYLAALRACEEMAAYLGEDEFAKTCGDLFRRGSAWIDEHLFNGDYYRHEVRPPGSEEAIAPGLRLPGIGARDLVNPELQIGDGCLADQLVGQELAHLAGLGYLLDAEHVKTTLRSILRFNRLGNGGGDQRSWGPEPALSAAGHFNPMRSYVLGDESGLLVASYPRGNRPERPFPYYAEVWTGLEYTAAVGMFYEGLYDEGVSVYEGVRARYDGRRRNPFNEGECGHHYVRAMASWGGVPALTGFVYDGVHGTLRFASSAAPVRWFWSNGYAWGTLAQQPSAEGTSVTLEVLGGELRARQLVLDGLGSAALAGEVFGAGARVEVTVPAG